MNINLVKLPSDYLLRCICCEEFEVTLKHMKMWM